MSSTGTRFWRTVVTLGLVSALWHHQAASNVVLPPLFDVALAQQPPPQSAEEDRTQLLSVGLRWQHNILKEAKIRYCDTETGEEIGWLMSPFLEGFYYGYLATGDAHWIDRLVDWTDSWVRRGVVEPDGYIGWPKVGAAGTDVDNLNSYYADSLVGEAMALRPVVLMSAVILKDPSLKSRYGEKAEKYIKLAQSMFEKWDSRGAWRRNGDTMITVVLPFGIDRRSGAWTEGYQRRNAANQGFSHPNNKANMVASWLLAVFDVTGDSRYKARADAWFRLMKSRMFIGSDGTYRIWSYWEPAGNWDYRPDGTPKHWIGVHRNAGYYGIDVDGIVEAYEHCLEFTDDDVRRLGKTAWVNSRLWPALVPYDAATKRRFDKWLNPDGWAGIVLAPRYSKLQTNRAE